jgi:hypothetical protein
MAFWKDGFAKEAEMPNELVVGQKYVERQNNPVDELNSRDKDITDARSRKYKHSDTGQDLSTDQLGCSVLLAQANDL